jgi:hypothetical protein
VVRSRLRRTVALVATTTVLAACGGGSHQIRDHVAETYDVISADADNVEARSDASVEQVTQELTGRFTPRDRYDEAAGTFFRYQDEFVAIRPDEGGGTRISVDDDETGSRRYVPIIGPIFLSGGRYGGPGQWNRGGGPGSGK